MSMVSAMAASWRSSSRTDRSSSPLLDVPYALRHAAVSTWLRTCGDPARVAEWAGHSVAVLLRVYAKCIHGMEKRGPAADLGGHAAMSRGNALGTTSESALPMTKPKFGRAHVPHRLV
jgi:hypothetical protein